MARLVIHLLGPFHVTLDGEAVTGFESNKVRALLAYLAMHAERLHSRETLAALLWPDQPDTKARHNLRQALSNLRQVLGDTDADVPLLEIARTTVQLDPQGDYWLDLAAFNAHVSASERHSHPRLERCAPCIEQLEQAAALYRGSFLEGLFVEDSVPFEEWATLQRERVHRLALEALYHLSRYHERRRDYVRARRYARRQVEMEPWREEAHQQLMRTLARSGQRSAALAQYEICRRTLVDELGVEPSAETQTLYQRIRAAGDTSPNNLSAQLTAFVGREEELTDVAERLADPACRLLTLVGPGGVGKTRLALQAAAEHGSDSLNGVFFAPLEAVHAPAHVISAIAQALDLSFSGEQDPRTQLLEHLRDKELLLVLDNLEHLISSVDWLIEILRHAPDVKILATSRQPLHLQAEWLLEVGGLSVPQPGATENPESYSAVALFAERARRAAANFVLTGPAAVAAARICQLVEGSPLAIELAAASVRAQAVEQIVAEIGRDLDFLATPLRDVPARHRSLRAVFEHSWGLLTQVERETLQQLSVFPSPFGIEAAKAITGATFHTLTALLDKSWVSQSQEGRYHLHPLLKQYTAEKLTHRASVAQRHTDFYLDFLAQQGSGETPAERAAISIELPHVRAAWEWAARQQDHAALERAAPILHSFYSAQSWFQEGISTFRFAIDQMDDPAATPLLCELLGRSARMHIHIGQLEAARSLLEQALSHLENVDDAKRRSSVLGYLAITHYYAGDYERAAGLAEHSRRLAEQSADRDGVAFALNFMGSCAKARGEYEQARRYFEGAVDAYRQMDDEMGAAMVLNNLGNLAQATGDYTEAQRHYRACSELFKAHDHTHGAATTLANAGKLALRQGAYEDARQWLGESLDLKREMNDRRGMAVALVSLGDVSAATGAFTDARQQLSEALTLAQTAGDVKLVLESLVSAASLALKQGQPDLASRWLAFVLGHPATAQEACEQAQALSDELGAPLPSVAQTWAQASTLEKIVDETLKVLGISTNERCQTH